MQTRFVRYAVLVGAAALAACDDRLGVSNPNVVDVDAAFRSTSGVEQIALKSFQALFGGQYNNGVDAIWPQAMALAGESGASVNNGGMNVRLSIPRQAIDNALGNLTQTGNNRDFSFFTRFARQNANAIRALDNITDTPVAKARARAVAYFNIGYALGHQALVYDSASVITPAQVDTANFAGATTVMTTALSMLDSAIAIASDPALSAPPTFPIPAGFFLNGAEVTAPRFIQVARSYKARFRAGVARTPAERGAVNWGLVAADAENGITTDFTIALDPTIGWNNGTIVQLTLFRGWHYFPSLYLGMADTSGTYNSYIAVGTFAGRNPQSTPNFLIRTPDRRFPSGDTRPLQEAANSENAPSTTIYFRNRPVGQDQETINQLDPWSNSQYDHTRFRVIRNNNGTGTFVLIDADEVAMLRAEALLRTGQSATAIGLINASRTRNGLPTIPTTLGINDPIPGPACVPRVPVSNNATTCGSVLEAMKWEKRMETALTGYAQWFIDGRGWGDLITGTPLEWPVPVQELFARNRTSYTSARRQAAPTTYGF
ncbi:MAG: hypothetical protein MUF21_02485 [Gemmatimonadaceae bacterium]|jgi:hypothetical protein|nr:hypothetical protein [Gemmatimonadaceae bacterium]